MTCEQGHSGHPLVNVPVRMRGHMWHDFPQIPERFADIEWDMWVFDSRPLDNHGGYCPGISSVSDTISSHGMWEPPETIAMLCAFEATPHNTFVDFGANVGYYSMLASESFLPNVMAIEGDPLVHEALTYNLPECECVQRWVDGAPLLYDTYPGERFTIKVDLEGADDLAIESIWSWIDRVDFAMIEISPVFNDRWQAMIRRLCDAGFRGALIPEKSTPPPKFDSLEDLTWLSADELIDVMDGWDQRDMMFRRIHA